MNSTSRNSKMQTAPEIPAVLTGITELSPAVWFPHSFTRSGKRCSQLEENARRFANGWRGRGIRLNRRGDLHCKWSHGLSLSLWVEADHANIMAFAQNVDTAFLPRPQRDLPAIASGKPASRGQPARGVRGLWNDSGEIRRQLGVHGAAFRHARDDHRC